MTSVSPFHCGSEPGKTNGRPSSRQIVAYTEIVSTMFMALPVAKPNTVCERCTLQVKPARRAASNSSSSCA